MSYPLNQSGEAGKEENRVPEYRSGDLETKNRKKLLLLSPSCVCKKGFFMGRGKK